MLAALGEAELEASRIAARSCVTGAGAQAFCAGQDLADVAVTDAGPPDLRAVLERYNGLVRKLRRLEMPVVCAVNGVAAGAGANLALASDIVLAAKSASFIQAFAKIGLIPDVRRDVVPAAAWSARRERGRSAMLAETAPRRARRRHGA